MLKELQDVGLSEKEARIYLAALELGPATAEQLAKRAKIVRSTAYVQIESLMKKGLMSTYEEGKKTFFAPESPAYLKQLFERERALLDARQKELESAVLPKLTELFESAGEHPAVRFFDGKEGIKALREEVLTAKDKDIYVISANNDLTTVFSQKELDDYSERRIKKGLVTHLLYTRAEGKLNDFKSGYAESTKHAYVRPDTLKLATDMVIFDDNVGIMTLKGKLLGTIIKSRDVRDSVLSIFKFIWAQAEKH